MSSTDKPVLEVDELEKRVAVLERKISREKKARNIAENKLEQYSLEIYQTNESLKKALASSTKKQKELEYLGRASSYVGSEMKLNEIIDNVVELTGRFCEADFGFYLVAKKGNIIQEGLNKVWCLNRGWQDNAVLIEVIGKLLPLENTELLNSWNVLDIDYFPSNAGQALKQVCYTNFALAGGKVGWLAILNSHSVVEPDVLSVLNTAREHLLSGISRRLTDLRILKRNLQLQESLEKLENARKQLIQSEKMASLGQLAAGVAHEINNPVAFIRSNMEVLQDYLKDYKLLHEDLKKITYSSKTLSTEVFKEAFEKIDIDYIDEDSVELLQSNIEGLIRVKDIVDNLKSFSHSGSEELTPIYIAECVDAALKVTGNAFKYEHQIDNQVSELNLTVLGNLGQLQQVFVNLFVNAAYAMEAGGELTISHSSSEEKVVIHITDTGQGMDKETVSQLFTPFFTTKPVGVGTGLGLSVSYAILEAHNAQVTVDSEVGVGTTFNLSFPTITQQ
ncbi:sensor histidine kinase [Paraglaciecola marina]|uniref:sensor histidine kinase n=1 Tax=Paraglaciecola marina TaxID=2500157 RepID=UPI0010601903|nr:ATP-binding protein [Paraglaciecola marina]